MSDKAQRTGDINSNISCALRSELMLVFACMMLCRLEGCLRYLSLSVIAFSFQSKASVRIPFRSFYCQFKVTAFIALSCCRFPRWEIGDYSSKSHCNSEVVVVSEAQRMRVVGWERVDDNVVHSALLGVTEQDVAERRYVYSA